MDKMAIENGDVTHKTLDTYWERNKNDFNYYNNENQSKMEPSVSQDDSTTEPHQNVKVLTKSFFASTSLKGISKVTKADTWKFRILWLVATLIGFGCGLYFLVTLILQYMSYSVVTNVESCTDCKPEFPDVTVCNLNSINFMETLSHVSFDEYISFVSNARTEYLANSNTGPRNPGSGSPNAQNRDSDRRRDAESTAFKPLYTIGGYMHNVMDDRFWEDFYANEGAHYLLVHACES